MAKVLGFSALGLLAVVGLCALGLVAWTQFLSPVAAWRNTPVYPGATDVQVLDYGDKGLFQEAGAEPVWIMKVVRFTAPASEAEVIDYYKRHWEGPMEPSEWGRETPARKALNYETSDGRAKSPSIYFADLITEPVGDHDTRVEIGLSMFPGY